MALQQSFFVALLSNISAQRGRGTLDEYAVSVYDCPVIFGSILFFGSC